MPSRILVVEDSPTQAQAVRRVLESAGYEVELARSGEEGLARFDAERCDAVISDVVMPGAIDGYELCRRIKSSEPGRTTPVMLLTSLSSPMDIIHGLASGADNFLTKPYDPDHVVERLQVLLSTREARASGKLRVGVDVYFMGQTFTINSDREQILDLLISTFEDAVRQNQALRAREEELRATRAELARYAQSLESRLERVLQSVPDVLFSMSADLAEMSYVSPASTHVVGFGSQEFMADAGLWIRRVEPDDMALVMERFGCAQRGESVNVRFRMRHRDGTVRWLDTAVVPVRNAQGEVERIDGIARDVTEARRLEERLRMSERRFQNLFESAPEAHIITDRRGTIVLANEQAEKTFGWTRQELVGQSVEMLMPQSNRKAHVALREGYLEDAVPRAMGGSQSLRGVRKGGKEFPVEISLSPMESDGDLLVASVVRDITERTQLQAQLLQAQKMELVGQLAGGVAHDFNNMLCVILGWTAMSLAESSPGDPLREALEEIRNAGEDASDLTRQLLAFSRKQLVEPTIVNVNELVAGADKMLRRLVGEQIEWTTRPNAAIATVKIDHGQLEQVLMNLVVNARDAMPAGGDITIETANVVIGDQSPHVVPDVAPGEYVLLAVTDTGTGMNEAVRARIFEPFFTTKERDKGTGLGLATCYGIARQAGGNIVASSEEGVGTTMKVYLPRSDATATVRRPPAGAPSRGVETILLVEDEPAVRRVTTRMLEAQGYRVVNAASGTEALRTIEGAGEPIDLLLTDVVLKGGMNGATLAERVRAQRPSQRILFVSGYTSDVSIVQGLLERGVALAHKPFTAELLGEKVREVLDAK